MLCDASSQCRLVGASRYVNHDVTPQFSPANIILNNEKVINRGCLIRKLSKVSSKKKLLKRVSGKGKSAR